MSNIQKIILIVCDTLRAKNIGLYGKNPSPSPNIDKLGSEGVVFINAYTTITKTDPSISSLMTGKYPLSIGIINHGDKVKPDEEKNVGEEIFLSEILQEHGFKTAAVDWLSRWHQKGFSYYSGEILKDFEGMNFIFKDKRILSYLQPFKKITIPLLKRELFLRYYYCFSDNPRLPYDSAEVVIDNAINCLKRNKRNKLFLYLHLWDTHEPHSRPTGLRSYLFDTVHDTYNAEVQFLDNQIGRLTNYLRETNQLKDTLIVLVADHGESINEHKIPLDHRYLYEEVVKIPLILSHPKLISKKIDSLVQHIDIFPTILDLIGVKPERKVNGVSLLPLITKQRNEVRDFAYFEDILKDRRLRFLNRTRRRGLRMGSLKYIETISGSEETLGTVMPREDLQVLKEELYDLKNDPLEKRNIIQKKPTTAKQMRKKLQDTICELNMERLQNNNHALYAKVEKSLAVIRQAAKKFNSQDIALAWTGGKDSTVLLYLVRLAFYGKVPFKLIFNDSTMEFEEIYDFIDRLKKLWDLKVITVKHDKKELKEFQETKDLEKKKLMSRMMKITAINQALKKYKFKAFMVGIRWDEHESRSKEKYFSSRPNHMRVHPILHFTEKDIWEYMKFFGVPYVDLYDKGYRSLGEKPFTKPVPPGGSERSGREREKEQTMARLRKMGYW